MGADEIAPSTTSARPAGKETEMIDLSITTSLTEIAHTLIASGPAALIAGTVLITAFWTYVARIAS